MTKPHYHVTAAIIRKDGKVLITRRPRGSHLAGYWEFPGGKQEPGEKLRQCLARELAEEIGIEARVDELFMEVKHTYPDRQISLHVFECTPLSGTPDTLQCSELKWISPTDLARFTFPPPDLKVIEKLKHRDGVDS